MNLSELADFAIVEETIHVGIADIGMSVIGKTTISDQWHAFVGVHEPICIGHKIPLGSFE